MSGRLKNLEKEIEVSTNGHGHRSELSGLRQQVREDKDGGEQGRM